MMPDKRKARVASRQSNAERSEGWMPFRHDSAGNGANDAQGAAANHG
jgi:hypothetical protein